MNVAEGVAFMISAKEALSTVRGWTQGSDGAGG